MPSVTTVPGRWPLIGHTATLLRNPVEFLSSLSATGDVVRVFLGPLPVHVVTTPELLAPDEFATGLVREGSESAVSRHTPHRDPRWFPNPGEFDPGPVGPRPRHGTTRPQATMQPNRLPMTATTRKRPA